MKKFQLEQSGDTDLWEALAETEARSRARDDTYLNDKIDTKKSKEQRKKMMNFGMLLIRKFLVQLVLRLL